MDTDGVISRITLIILPLFTGTCILGVQINVITVIFDDDPATGFHAIAPVYDVALDRIMTDYPLFVETPIHYSFFNTSSVTDPDVEEARYQTVMEVYRYVLNMGPDNIAAIFSSGRNDDIHLLGDFAREMNVSLFASSATDSLLADRSRFPTTYSTAPSDSMGYAPALRAYLDRFSWKYITVLCDESVDYQLASPANTEACQNIASSLGADPTAYEEKIVHFNPDKQDNYTGLLSGIRGRAKTVLTRESTMRHIMIDTGELGMANGKYVFIYLQPVQSPDSQVLSWMYHDRDDVTAFSAFRNLIVISYVGIQWTKLADLFTAFSDKSEAEYSTKADPKTLNAYAVSAYESVSVFAKVWNETLMQQNPQGQAAYDISGRKFNLDSGQVVIGSDGLRKNDAVIFHFNDNAKNFQPVWYFSSESQQLMPFKSDADERWPGGATPVSDRQQTEVVLRVIPPNLGISIVAAIMGIMAWLWSIYAIREWLNSRANSSTWWQFDHSKFTKFEYMKSKNYAAYGITARDYGFPIAHLEEETVWIQTSTSEVSLDDITNHNGVRQTLSEIRALQHSHIGRLYGVTIHDNRMHLVWQFGRCTLRSLLDDEKFQMDAKLKAALIFELISGMEAIHSSALQYHGSLSSVTATLDAMYSIKICAAGSSNIFGALTKSRSGIVSPPLDLWLAPEMLKNPKLRGSKSADMYALGMVLCEIMAGSSIPVDIDTPDATYATWTMLTSIVHSSSNALRRQSFAAVIPETVRQTILNCFSFDDAERPSILELKFVMSKAYKATSVMEQMLRRFQIYSDNLELTVAARTEELVLEEAKTVALLEEMMPKSLVVRLRNREPIPAETFDCVTLFFSSLVGFAEFCRLSSPLAIINLLNTAYTIFDQSLVEFDVYKVETIKDGYMIASGLPIRNGDTHASEIALLAEDFLKQSLQAPFLRTDSGQLELRIGIHSGTVAACVVGNLMPRYCLFGDTVNTGSRMESSGEPSKIHMSHVTADLLRASSNKQFSLHSRGIIPIKGKGEMETFWLEIF